MKRAVLLISLLVAFQVLPSSLTAQTPISISGRIWQDSNGDGRIDPVEPVLPNQVVLVYSTLEGWKETRTDSSGRYQFPNVVPGDNKINLGGQIAGLDWVLTYPVRLMSGEVIEFPVDVSSGSRNDVNVGLFSMASIARFRGAVSAYGSPVSQPNVDAVVNGKVCSFQSGIVPPTGSRDLYAIAVASETLTPGCARPGDQVSFRVNGLPANESAIWQAAESLLHLSVGAPTRPSAPVPSAPTPPRSDPSPLIQPPSTGDAGLQNNNE